MQYSNRYFLFFSTQNPLAGYCLSGMVNKAFPNFELNLWNAWIVDRTHESDFEEVSV